MSKTLKGTTAEQFDHATKRTKDQKYVLRLYVTGMTPRSTRAIENLRAVCDEHLKGRYTLEIIDIYQHPNLLQGEQIIATPTLVKKLPAPLRRMVGDLSDVEKVLMGLDLKPGDKGLSGK